MAQKFTVPITVKQLTSASSDAVTVFVDADTFARLKVEAGGRLVWGDGSVAGDVNLYRASADVLQTDDTFKTPILFVDNIEIDPTGATTNQLLQFNGTKFVAATVSIGGGGATNLNELNDVVITAPEEFQTLEYNGTEWVNTYSSVVSNVRNAEATTLTTGTVVYLFGATGDHATVKRADKASDTTSSKTVGLVGANILASNNGPVVTRGYVDGIDLSVGYTPGDVLWLGSNGAFTTTKPTAPDHLVFVGVVVRATNNGIVYVATQNGYELDELHNVSIPSPVSGDFLKYNGTLWVNDQINLGTDTVGNYMSDVSAGTGISVTHTPSEGSTGTVAIDTAVVPRLGVTNTFSTNQIISGSTTADLLRITQTGTGNALVVEDSTNPDATAFIINADGNVGIGGAPTANIKLTLTGDTANSANATVRLTGVSGSGTLNFHNDLGAGSYNNITAAGSKGIIASGANSTTSRASFVIAPWSDVEYGIRFEGGSTTNILQWGTTIFQPSATTSVASIVRGRTSQVEDLQEWQNSAGTVLGGVNAVGQTYTGSSTPIFVASTGGATTAASGTGTVATITTTNAHGFAVGDIVTVSGVTPTGYNGTFILTAVATNTISYANTTTGAQTVAGSVSAPAQASVVSRSAGTTAMIIRQNSSTGSGARPFLIQNSSGGQLAYVDNYGGFYGAGYGTPNQNGGYATTNSASPFQFSTASTTITPLLVKGIASQTADLQQWQNSAGTTLVSISSDGYINKTGTTFIGPQLTFANPGVGNDTRFTFTKTSDAAWLSVVEMASDQTYYEFGMSDNPSGGDYFQWKWDTWESPGQGWMPLQMAGFSTRFTSSVSNWGSFSIPVNSPFATTNTSATSSTTFQVNKYAPINSTAYSLNKDSGTGTGTVTLNAQSFTGTSRLGYWIVIDAGATTFTWGNGSTGSTAVGTGVAITGSAQTLSNGVSVTISLTGHVAGDRWSFLCFPRPTSAIGGSPIAGAMQIIYPSADITGLVVKGAGSQTADLQQWQNSSASVLAKVTAGGSIFATELKVTAGNSLGDSGGVGSYLVANTTNMSVITRTATNIGLIVKGVASQTANLQEWQNSSSTVMAHVDSSGNAKFASIDGGSA